MKSLVFQFVLVLNAIAGIEAQERLDVIYMKNGNILKGVIVENVPNDHIRIELPGGSLITLKYLEIAKFVKESPSNGNNVQPSASLFPNRPASINSQAKREERLIDLPQFRRGVYQLSGGITYSSSSYGDYNKETGISASPGFSKFLFDGFLIGFQASYNSFKSDWTEMIPFDSYHMSYMSPNSYNYSSYGAGLSLRYYAIGILPLPFLGGSIGFEEDTPFTGPYFMNYSLEAGFSFPISLNMGIEPFVKCDITDMYEGSTSKTMLSAGFRVAYYVFE